MKYSTENINNISYHEWMETIANELNAAGFKGEGYNAAENKFMKNVAPYKVSDDRYFFMGAINDAKAMDYLKSIGLVNNGRCPICGSPIKNEIDINGKKMTDFHLKEEVAKHDPKFKQVYNQASGYIHLSEKAFYQIVTDLDNHGKLTLQVGHALPERQNKTLIECAEAFLHFILLHYEMLNTVGESKKRFDKSLMT